MATGTLGCPRRVAVAFTGGKDSCLALHHCLQRPAEYTVELLVTFTPVVAKFLAHPIQVIEASAAATGIPWRQLVIETDDYLTGYERHIRALALDALVTGDMADVCENFMGRACAAAGVDLVRPLWGADRAGVLRQLLDTGHQVIYSCINIRACPRAFADRLVGKSLLGPEELLAAYAAAMDADSDCAADAAPATCGACRKPAAGLDLAGEFGEFHTWTLAGPAFKAGRLTVAGRAQVSECGGYVYFALESCSVEPTA